MSKDLQAWLKDAPFRAKRELVEVIQDEAEKLVEAIRNAAPSKTGKLRASIKVRRTRNELRLDVTAGGDETTTEVRSGSGEPYDYVLAVEFGTSKMPAQPFFYPTYRALEPEIRERIEQAVAEALAR